MDKELHTEIEIQASDELVWQLLTDFPSYNYWNRWSNRGATPSTPAPRPLMTEHTLFTALLIGWFALAGVTFLALFFVVARYGRHTREGGGPTVSNRSG